MKLLGYAWLKKYYEIHSELLQSICLQGRDNKTITDEEGIEWRYFGTKYTPFDEPMAHLEFAFKYELLNLSLLCKIFQKIDTSILIESINNKPNSVNGRKIGFLFEFITQQTLPTNSVATKNYVLLLDESKFVTGISIYNDKWKIKNNLLGTPDFCPIIIKNKIIEKIDNYNIAESLQEFQKKYSPSVYRRAFNYLYTKETKSSFEIEREKPSPNKMEKFVALLTKAGIESDDSFLSEITLKDKQNKIVDERFAADGWRDFQNYIGETLPDYSQLVHYVCPPPPSVKPMMEGLNLCYQKSKNNNAVVLATLIAFGFVFIHPFDDGNGRLHRYLIHDILVRKKAVASGMIVPVSAQMLENLNEYDHILELYSKPLMGFIRFNLDNQGELTIQNPLEVLPYFKYPNLTRQCEYLFNTLIAAISKIENELDYLNKYDLLKIEIENHLDLPDKLLNYLIIFIHQNKGTLSKNKRKQFEKLLDTEIEIVEKLYQQIFD